jgi:hypothetical protein
VRSTSWNSHTALSGLGKVPGRDALGKHKKRKFGSIWMLADVCTMVCSRDDTFFNRVERQSLLPVVRPSLTKILCLTETQNALLLLTHQQSGSSFILQVGLWGLHPTTKRWRQTWAEEAAEALALYCPATWAFGKGIHIESLQRHLSLASAFVPGLHHVRPVYRTSLCMVL